MCSNNEMLKPSPLRENMFKYMSPCKVKDVTAPYSISPVSKST